MRKSRHARDESDILLGLYSNSIQTTDGYEPEVEEATVSFSDPNLLWEMDYGSTLPVPAPPSATNVEEGMAARRRSQLTYRVHRRSYCPKEHLKVLFRLRRSTWPEILPFLYANVAWTLVLFFLRYFGIVDLTLSSSQAYSAVGILVSFLIVSRCTMSYDRFMTFRRHLAEFYQACRDMARYTTVYTQETRTKEAAHWREEVSYRTILLLRVTMDALLWSSMERSMWGKSYFESSPEHDVNGKTPRVSEHFHRVKRLIYGRSSHIAENFRSPHTFAQMLSDVIMRHPHFLGYKMPVLEYNKLLQFVDNFIGAFHGCRVLVFTPYPFPLLQLGRLILFCWVFSFPMVMLKECRLLATIVSVSVVTVGFIGLEYISMSLADPFGDDTNDVDEHGMSMLVYEDIYLAIYRTDGPEAAVKLRNRVLKRYHQGRELKCYRDDLEGEHMWEPEWWWGSC